MGGINRCQMGSWEDGWAEGWREGGREGERGRGHVEVDRESDHGLRLGSNAPPRSGLVPLSLQKMRDLTDCRGPLSPS